MSKQSESAKPVDAWSRDVASTVATRQKASDGTCFALVSGLP